MIRKEEILKDLNNYLTFEEEIVKKLSSFYLALGWKNDLSRDSCVFIENGLTTLKTDTDKHIKIVAEIIKYLTESKKNEF